MSRSEDPNDYVVHDPLLEKGKEKFNKMQAKEKRRQREWAGKSLTWSLKNVIQLTPALKTSATQWFNEGQISYKVAARFISLYEPKKGVENQ